MFQPEAPTRDPVPSEEAAALERSGVLFPDQRRRRPLYFDGRFLAARDLTRDQNYFLARQADLARAVGSGVAEGLMVERDPESATSIRIAPGLGVTGSGEVVALREGLSVDLSDVPAIQRLDAAFGLLTSPREAARNLTGLFLVALRPVEYAANPVAAYPTEIDGARSVHPGDLIEAVAVTLVPYAATAAGESTASLRSAAAREIFVQRRPPQVPPGMLALAMVSLQRQVVEWVDPFLARRELATARGGLPGFGMSSAAEAEAFFLQYDRHLADVLEVAGSTSFPAAQHFAAVPSMGRLPAGAIRAVDFTQVFFPPEFDVELSLVPEDELSALWAESLTLPPIDLSGSPPEAASVLILAPIPRQAWEPLVANLPALRHRLASAAPGMVAKRKPLESLRLLKQSATEAAEEPNGDPWRKVLQDHPRRWYLRRRQLPLEETYATVFLTGTSVPEPEPLQPEPEPPEPEPPEPEPEPPEPEPEPPEPEPPEPPEPEPGPQPIEPVEFEGDWPAALLKQVLDDLEFERRSAAVRERASETARRELNEFFALRHLQRTPTVLLGLIAELEALENVHAQPVRSVTGRYAADETGTGILRIESANRLFRETRIIDVVSRSNAVPELDLFGRKAEDAQLRAVVEADLPEVVRTERPEAIGRFIREKLVP